MNTSDVNILLRDFYMKEENAPIKKLFSYNELLDTLYKNIQRSRYEQLIIKLANAYKGYHFDLPAFLDFRGRVYRCGILHFHERDLARSMILFADSDDSQSTNTLNNHEGEISYKLLDKLVTATAFHYKSFNSIEDSHKFIEEHLDAKDDLIESSRDAKRPFQYIANLTALYAKK